MILQVCVITPDGIFRDETSEELVMRTRTGQVGILTGHAPIVSALEIGIMLSRTQNNWSATGIMGGFALVQKDQVKIIVNEAISSKSEDQSVVADELAKSKRRLEAAETMREVREAKASLKRSQVRYQIASSDEALSRAYNRCSTPLLQNFSPIFGN